MTFGSQRKIGIKIEIGMRAKSFDKYRKTIQYPVACQPKIDGIRCLTDGRIFASRNNLPFHRSNMSHLLARTAWRRRVDGELYIPGVPFEELVSIVKRADHPDAAQIQLHAFDLEHSSWTFAERIRILRTEIATSPEWKLVETKNIKSEDELEAYSKAKLAQGYEGIMVRTLSGLYVHGETSDLLKYKPTIDKEFPIAAVKEGAGKAKGTPIFTVDVGRAGCIITCEVRPKGNQELLKRMWRERKQLIGKMLTVQFQGYTRDGSLRFPRGLAVRDYE